MHDIYEPFLYTVVTFANGGTVRFNRCVADIYRANYLTISSTDEDNEFTFLDGWRLAVVYDHNDHIQYAHEHRRAAQAAA